MVDLIKMRDSLIVGKAYVARDMEKILSDLRQKIVWLREEREKLENSLFRPRKMIRASLVFLANYCGKKDCRCRKGFPHGPYPYLSERKKRKTRMTYVKKKNLYEIKAEAEEYARFQHRLVRLTKINEKIIGRYCFFPTFRAYKSSAKIESF